MLVVCFTSSLSPGNAIKSADQPPPNDWIGFRALPRRIAAHLRVQCREGFRPLIASGPTYRISTATTPPRTESEVARVCDDLIERPPSLFICLRDDPVCESLSGLSSLTSASLDSEIGLLWSCSRVSAEMRELSRSYGFSKGTYESFIIYKCIT